MKKNIQADMYFSQVREIRQRIEQNETVSMQLKARAEKTTSWFSPVPPQGNAEKRKMADNLDLLADVRAELEKDRAALSALLPEVKQVIGAVTDSEYRVILELYYLGDTSLTKIAELLHYSCATVSRKYYAALSAAAIPNTFRLG